MYNTIWYQKGGRHLCFFRKTNSNSCLECFCMLVINSSKEIFYHMLFKYFTAASHTLLFATNVLQHNNVLLCANISLLQAKRLLIVYCSLLIFYHVCYVLAARYILLYAYYKLQQGNLYRVIIFPCCKLYIVLWLIINCSKVIFYHVLIFSSDSRTIFVCKSLTAAR